MTNVNTSKRRKVETMAACASVLLTAAPVIGQQVIAKLDGTSQAAFRVGATGPTPLSLQNVSGRLTLANGLRVTAGTIDFTGATLDGFSLIGGAISGVTIDDSIIGGATPAAGTFSTIAGPLNGTVGATTPASGSFTTLTSTGGAINGTVGATTPASGAFTSVAASGQITSSVSTGTSPFVVASTTTVPNLNADLVDGYNLAGISTISTPLFRSGSNILSAAATNPSSGFKIWAHGSAGAITLIAPSAAGNLILSNAGSGWSEITMAGDATINSSGTLTIGSSAITSAKILDGTIVANDLAGDSVTSAKILDGTIVANDLAGDAVTSAKILDGTIVANDLASDSVTSAKILDGTIVANDLASDSVTTAKIVNANVTAAKLADAVADAIVTAIAGVGPEGEFGANTIRVGLQIQDAQANNLSGYYMVHWGLIGTSGDATVWGGTPAAISYVAGTQWATSDFGKKQVSMTSSAGQLTIDVTVTGDNTLYFAAAVGAKFYQATLDFD